MLHLQWNHDCPGLKWSAAHGAKHHGPASGEVQTSAANTVWQLGLNKNQTPINWAGLAQDLWRLQGHWAGTEASQLNMICVKMQPMIFRDVSGSCKVELNTDGLGLTRTHTQRLQQTQENTNPSSQRERSSLFWEKRGLFSDFTQESTGHVMLLQFSTQRSQSSWCAGRFCFLSSVGLFIARPWESRLWRTGQPPTQQPSYYLM